MFLICVYGILWIFASGNFGENVAWKVCSIFTESYFLLFDGLLMKTYSRVLFFAVSIFGDFKEVTNSAKIKPHTKNSQYMAFQNCFNTEAKTQMRPYE